MPHLLFYFSLVNGVGQKLYFAGMGMLFFLGAGARIPAGDDDDHDCIDTTDNDDDEEEMMMKRKMMMTRVERC